MTDKEKFCEALRATGRRGIEETIEGLEKLGFFDAPASTRFHGSVPGGLLVHSLNVFTEARLLREMHVRMCPHLATKLSEESIAIVSLLHDVCKAEVYQRVQKFRKDANDRWEKYMTYGVDYSSFPVGHGEKSVIRLLQFGLELTDDEILAIRWHMHAFDLSDSSEAKSCYSAATEKSPLLAILIAADGLSSHLLEREEKENSAGETK